MVYNDRHRKIVQTLMTSSMDEESLRALCIETFNDESVEKIVSEINEYISQELPHISICSVRCELTGEQYWVYNSTHAGAKETNDMPKLSSHNWPESKISFVKNVFYEIITSESGCIQSTHCLNLSSLPDVKLYKKDAEELLNMLTEENWLSCKDGQYYVGPKSAVTLLPYFKDNYNDYIKACSLCKQTVFHGEKCRHCCGTVHIYCLKNFISVHNSLVRCPECNNFLTTSVLSS